MIELIIQGISTGLWGSSLSSSSSYAWNSSLTSGKINFSVARIFFFDTVLLFMSILCLNIINTREWCITPELIKSTSKYFTLVTPNIHSNRNHSSLQFQQPGTHIYPHSSSNLLLHFPLQAFTLYNSNHLHILLLPPSYSQDKIKYFLFPNWNTHTSTCTFAFGKFQYWVLFFLVL